jgi:CheY-like chemotaxis protein
VSTNSQPYILIADDQQDVLEALRLLLKGEGFRIDTVTSPAGIVAALEENDFDALLMDLNYTRDTTSGREGLDLLPQITDLDLLWSRGRIAVRRLRELALRGPDHRRKHPSGRYSVSELAVRRDERCARRELPPAHDHVVRRLQ